MGDAESDPPGSPRAPSTSCWKHRKKCHFQPGAGACERCRKLQRACEPRKHARRARAEWRRALSSSGSSDAAEGDSGSPAPPPPRDEKRKEARREVKDEAAGGTGSDLAASADLGLTTFWASLHPSLPIVHRATFDVALCSPSTIYRQPPQALALAMAACGILHAAGLPEEDRILRSAALCDAACALVFSSYNPGSPTPGMTDLEAAQASILLVHALAPHGHAPRAGALLRTAAAAAERMLPRPPQGTLRFAHLAAPGGAEEWVENEMMLRTYILVASLDVSFALQGHRRPHATYFDDGYIPLPHHDSLFDHPDPPLAHSLLPLPPAAVRPAPFLADPRPESCAALAAQFVSPALSRLASHMSLRLLAALYGALRCRLAEFARAQGVDALRAAALPDAERDADERAHAAHSALLAALGRSIAPAFPDPHAAALARGDAAGFLADAGRPFSHPGHAAAALGLAACAAAGGMDALLAGCRPAAGNDARLWTAPGFAGVLADAALFMRTLRSAGGRGFGHDAVQHVVRAGALALAGRRLMGRVGTVEGDPGEFAADVKTAEGWLEAWGARHGGVARLVADEFRAAAAELLHPSPPPPLSPSFPGASASFILAASASSNSGISAGSTAFAAEEELFPLGIRAALARWDDAKQGESFLEVQAAADRVLAAWAC
ncbi:hypothetical protein DFJ74DRAFT_720196 [Hyaloraphidium curvatum]|nr:hypothetical protein DFJ74DRAFT_720196 [Hyaloraphidium curvatum]